MKREHIQKAKAFAEAIVCGNNMPSAGFLNDRVQRPTAVRILDCSIGKLAEEAFSAFLHRYYDISFQPDYNIYETQWTTDGGSDITKFTIDGIELETQNKIDVKCSRGPCHWIIETPAVAKKADVMVLIQADVDNNERNSISLLDQDIMEFTVWGYVVRKDMFHKSEDGKDWIPKFYFRNGDPLYDPVKLFDGNTTIVRSPVDVDSAIVSGKANGQYKEFRANIQAREAVGYPRFALRNSDKDWVNFIDWLMLTSKAIEQC